MIQRTVAMVLAGGAGTRLNVLAWSRAKPAVPFAGLYRIIDFSLSNALNAGIPNVAILTQYRPRSLEDHIGFGKSWDYGQRSRTMRILPPHTGEDDKDWYRGTANAVFQNLGYVEKTQPEQVFVLSGDHIYGMDFAEMLAVHNQSRAALTMAVMEVPLSEAPRFGLAITDHDDRVVGFQEKPAEPRSPLASMGIYVFDAHVMIDELTAMARRREDDFGKHVIPKMLGRLPIQAYRFRGYWRDVGTLSSLRAANLDALTPASSGLDIPSWGIRTNLESRHLADRQPALVGSRAVVNQAMIAPGCRIEGTVERSVLSPGVVVEAGAVVRGSVLMHDTTVGAGAVVHNVISDKDVSIGARAQVGVGSGRVPNRDYPAHLDGPITLLGKGCRLPNEARVGSACLVGPKVTESTFAGPLDDGDTLLHDA